MLGRYLSSLFCLCATLSLKDTELRSSSQDSQKIVKELRETASMEAKESTQVIESVSQPGGGVGPGAAGAIRARGGPAAQRGRSYQH